MTVISNTAIKFNKKRPGSAFDEPDMVIGLFCEFLPPFQPGDIRDRFKDMDGVFQKRENICGKYLDTVFVCKERGDLPVVKPVLPQFQDLLCKLLLRATAERAVPAVTAQEIIEKCQYLFPYCKIKGIIVDARGERFEHRAVKCAVG